MSEISNQSGDLNQDALKEFILLVEQNSILSEDWKTLLLQLVSDGFPEDYSLLINSIKGGENPNVSSENLES